MSLPRERDIPKGEKYQAGSQQPKTALAGLTVEVDIHTAQKENQHGRLQPPWWCHDTGNAYCLKWETKYKLSVNSDKRDTLSQLQEMIHWEVLTAASLGVLNTVT